MDEKIRKIILAAGLLITVTSLSACGHNSVRPEGGMAETHGSGGLLGSGTKPEEAKPSSEASLNQPVLGVSLQHRDFDMPVVYNQEVQNWVEYFNGPGRRYFSVYLDRMNEYKGIIQPKLKAAGLPQDLIFLAMIESGFSTQAKSHAGAVGQWQFMRSTGRLFGLKADWWVDERSDPSKAADAAVEYLGRLHGEFNSWELATAAYNAGEVKVRNAIARLHTRDFWEIAKNRRALRKETRDYVPKMMAAAIIAKNAEQFGFHPAPGSDRWQNTVEVNIPRTENLRAIAKAANIDREELRELNPELLRCCTPPKTNSYSLRLPKGEAAAKVAAAVESGELGQYKDFDRVVIRRGDTLSKIASNHHVPIEAIVALNELPSVRRLKPGTELVIPEGGSARIARSSRGSRAIASEVPGPAGKKHLLYVVQKGDTLDAISRRYSVRVKEIRAWNSLRRSKLLRPGSRLKLYVSNESAKENI